MRDISSKGEGMYNTTEQVVERINQNYYAIQEITKVINQQPNTDNKLALASICGILYSEYVTGVYDSSFIEGILSQIANDVPTETLKTPQKDKYLIVMTSAGTIGGHSVIVNNWIMWDEKIQYSIAFTNSKIGNVPDFLKKAVKKSNGNMFFLEGNDYDKAKQLQTISLLYEKIILFQHMYDIIPNLAYGNKEWRAPIFLYNHANFKFSFGYQIADVILNLCDYDLKKSVNNRGILNREHNMILQFPNGGKIVEQNAKALMKYTGKENIRKKYEIPPQKKLVVSMGDGFKFTNIIGYSFNRFVCKLISERVNNDIQFVIIGPNPKEKNWRKLEEITRGKAKAIGYVRREEANEIIAMADLYITSFPMMASGTSIAEENGVPYLFMSVTGREIENYGNNAVSTVEELLQKSNEILDGNKEKYMGTYYKKILNQEQWCNKWHKIADSITVHKGQQIYPQRLIGTEEIVNCQLMQEKAGENVKRLLPQFKLTPKIMRTLLEINEKYEMDCIPEEFTVIDYKTYQQQNELLQQKMKLLEYSNKWLNLNLKGYHIKNYFQDRGIKSIAIYGMGQIGLNLFEELKNSSVETECFIDRFADRLNAPIKIIGLDQNPITCKTIITTVWISEDQLRKDYACLTDEYEIISLFDIIESICKGE